LSAISSPVTEELSLSKSKSMRSMMFLVVALFAVQVLAAEEGEDPLESSDALVRAKARGMLSACADPYEFPHAQQNSDPPGFDVEILRAVAKRAGMRLDMVWVNTASRGGTSRAFRQSILARKCDVFLGMSDNGDDDMLMGKLAFTRPYLGMGYVLVTQGRAANKTTLDEFRDSDIKVGVSMSTPMDDYLFMNKIPRDLYMGTKRILDAMMKGEIDASMLFSTTLGTVKQDYPKASFKMVPGYMPIEGLRYNAAWVVRKEDKSLRAFIDEGIGELLDNGKIQEIVESYGVPFYPPFAS
jgi:ABC-type amino acid transport substrate-binding protein